MMMDIKDMREITRMVNFMEKELTRITKETKKRVNGLKANYREFQYLLKKMKINLNYNIGMAKKLREHKSDLKL